MSASPYSSRGSAEPPTLVNPGAGTATQGRLYDQVFGGDDDDNDNDADPNTDNDEDVDDAAEPKTSLNDEEAAGPRADEDEDSAQSAARTGNADVDEDEDDAGDDAVAPLKPAGDDADSDKDGDDDAEAADERDEDVDEDRDEDEAFAQGSSTTPSKVPSFKKKERRADIDEDVDEDEDEDRDDDDEDAERRRKKKRKEKKEKRARKERAEEDVDEDDVGEVLTEAELRKKQLHDRIDSIGKKVKIPRKKKKTDEDVDIVDSFHDDLCVRLRDRMAEAAERDSKSVQAKRPATAKLAMLDETMAILRNTTLWQSIIDNGVLEAVRMWLEPIPPVGALPAVGIQKAIFEVLPKMDLDTQTLKECRLGPIVLFYTRAKRVTPEIGRQADTLVQAWSRPIIKRPANLRSRHVQTASEAILEPRTVERGDRDDGEGMEGVEDPVAPKSTVTKKRRFDVMAAVRDNEGRKGARLFNTRDMQYTVAPESQTLHRKEDKALVDRIRSDNAKFNKFARQMKAKK